MYSIRRFFKKFDKLLIIYIISKKSKKLKNNFLKVLATNLAILNLFASNLNLVEAAKSDTSKMTKFRVIFGLDKKNFFTILTYCEKFNII
jgi:hypothetical protein